MSRHYMKNHAKKTRVSYLTFIWDRAACRPSRLNIEPIFTRRSNGRRSKDLNTSSVDSTASESLRRRVQMCYQHDDLFSNRQFHLDTFSTFDSFLDMFEHNVDTFSKEFFFANCHGAGWVDHFHRISCTALTWRQEVGS